MFVPFIHRFTQLTQVYFFHVNINTFVDNRHIFVLYYSPNQLVEEISKAKQNNFIATTGEYFGLFEKSSRKNKIII